MKGCGLSSSFLLLMMMMISAAFALGVARDDFEDVIDNDGAVYKRSTCEDKISERWCQWYRQKGYCAKTNPHYKYFEVNCASTCAVCKSSTNGVEKVNVNINECLRAHNSKRALHGARPLTWDSALARQAQAYAIKLAETNNFDHDPNRGFVGENLQWFSAYSKGKTCKDAVDEWYSEVEMYPFSNPDSARRNWQLFHFTQVVWKATKHLGVGIAKNPYRVYIVARYTPPGNYGSFAQNVGNIRRR